MSKEAEIEQLRATLGANQLILLALIAQLNLTGQLLPSDIDAIRKIALDRANALTDSSRSDHQVHADRMRREIARIMNFLHPRGA
jgi:ribosomal protein L29